ncbi:MAG: glycine cleavage system protein H, partial [Sulfolobaceae archaeon]
MLIDGFEFPEELLYDPEKHIWVSLNENIAIIGITSLGQYLAGKIFQISVKEKGSIVTPRTIIFTIESAKWIGRFRLPVEGVVLEINEEVIKKPEIINKDPYKAWIIKIYVNNLNEFRNSLKKIHEVKKNFEDEIRRLT